jgi:CRISPR-associated protein Csy1
VTADPRNARAWNNLGNSLRTSGRLREAAAAFEHAVGIRPDYALALANLGSVRRDLGDSAAAESTLRSALAIDPKLSAALLALGSMYRHQGRLDEAIALFARGAQAAPKDARPCLELAAALAERDDVLMARRVYAEAQTRDPASIRAQLGSRLTLPMIAESTEALAAARAEFEQGLSALDRTLPALMRPQDATTVLDGLRWSNFLLAYQGGDDRALQARYATLVGDAIAVVAPAWRESLPARNAGDSRVRVGFVSSFFRDGTVGRYFEHWITDLDRAAFEVVLYHLQPGTDALFDRLAARADIVRNCPRWLPSWVAAAIRDDAPDVLIYPELGMDATVFALAALRLAPLQCSAWGHPVTTGHATIDVFFSSAAMEPADGAAHYVEKLVRIPGIGTRYARPAPPADASRHRFGLPDDAFLFLCPQSLFKIHPDNDALFARVLAAAPGARLVLFEGRHPTLTAKYLARLDVALAREGIGRDNRVDLLAQCGHDEYLRINRVCDAMLDTLHWSGGNTSLDALACGLPIVTLPGRFMRGRQSAGMLRLMDLDELVARDVDDYIGIAIRLAQDAAWRAALSSRIMAAHGRVFDDRAAVAALARFLRQAAPRADQAARDSSPT